MEKRVVLRLAGLTALPMAAAAAGAWLDERLSLGFTTWRTACRAAGLQWSSVLDFTLQLLPWASCGLLVGGLILLVMGAVQRRRHARHCLAAHAGCALSLPLGLLLCASSLPVAVMLLADLAAAAAAALLLVRMASRFSAVHP